ncbi:MAG: acyl-CoA dehydrogenase C-terminal domain-containing protein [Alphaproteobacteria bacterium]|nr:acyl-CoA dehydrogenase C-terminal domain-containing protein [Alphaproteobacteria bacterium]
MRDVIGPLKQELAAFEDATRWLQTQGLRAKAGDEVAAKKFQAAANHYMELMYGVASGVALARQAEAAAARLQAGGLEEAEVLHYRGMIDTARYYAHDVLKAERDMHMHKMKHNWRHLKISDLGVADDRQTLFAKGAEAVTGAVIRMRDVYHDVTETIGNGLGGR